MAWARPYSQAAHGATGYLEGNLFHLWHGEQRYREPTICYVTCGTTIRFPVEVSVRSVDRGRPLA